MSEVSERQRIDALTPKEREEELKNWLKGVNPMKLELALAFDKMELYGVNVVKNILSGNVFLFCKV